MCGQDNEDTFSNVESCMVGDYADNEISLKYIEASNDFSISNLWWVSWTKVDLHHVFLPLIPFRYAYELKCGSLINDSFVLDAELTFW